MANDSDLWEAEFDAVVGTCTRMCSEAEIRLRERENLLHPFEVAPGHTSKSPKADINKMVKEYRRPTVGKDTPSPADLRPSAVLRETVNYLMDRIVTSGQPWSEIYDFVFDRLRAVRRDLVIQQIEGDTGIDILEKCVRFLIFSDYRLCTEKPAVFDQKISNQHTQECLKRLLMLYQKSDSHNTNRPLFESLYLLFNLAETDALKHYYTLDSKLRNHPVVRHAYEVSISHLLGNWIRLFRLVQQFEEPILLCAVHRHIPVIQCRALQVMSAGYSSKNLKFPLATLTDWLVFSSDTETRQACEQLGVSVQGTSAQFLRATFKSSEQLPRCHSEFINRSLQCCDIRDVLPGQSDEDLCYKFTETCTT